MLPSTGAKASGFIDVPLGTWDVEVAKRDDGAILMRSKEVLAPYPRVITERLFETTRQHPDRVFIAERGEGGEWRRVTYVQAAAQVLALAQALLSRDLGPDRPVAILSAGSNAHALLAMAAAHSGIPYCPVSPAYSLLAKEFSKLDHVLGLLTPGLVYVESAAEFDRALKGTSVAGFEVAALREAEEYGHTPFEALLAAEPTGEVDAAHAAIRPDDVIKILFTSGSTGAPKGVTNTHRMICSNQQMFLQNFPVMGTRPPVLLSWLPWHHTSGANMILGMTAYLGGTLYIDDGKPVPGLMDKTIRNLREISPTAYFSAASAFQELIPALWEDEALRRNFFRDLGMFYYSGSSMPQPIIDELNELGMKTLGAKVPFFSNFGSTETSPVALGVNWPDPRGGLVGLPVPGVEIKLHPVDGRLEGCVRGPNVTPGYWRQPALTAKAFDDEGFYHFGDAMAPVEPDDFTQGLTYEGRLGENFKLLTGTWVSVGLLRDRLMTEASPLLRDAVITGENRNEIGALLFLDALQARRHAGLPDDAPAVDAYGHPSVVATLQDVLDRLAAKGSGSSTFVARAMILPTPPDGAVGEITDKGSVSQKTVLKTRKADVEALHNGGPRPEILIAGAS